MQGEISSMDYTSHAEAKSFIAEDSATVSSQEQIVGLRNNLQTRNDKYKKAFEQSLDVIDDDKEIESIICETTKFNIEVELLLVQLRDMSCPAASDTATCSNIQSTSHHGATSNLSAVKLPKLELKKFGGDAIHQNFGICMM